jgi:hypothetical protein
MATLRARVSRLAATPGPRRADRELEQELRAHLALAAEDAERRGQSPADARRAAAPAGCRGFDDGRVHGSRGGDARGLHPGAARGADQPDRGTAKRMASGLGAGAGG